MIQINDEVMTSKIGPPIKGKVLLLTTAPFIRSRSQQEFKDIVEFDREKWQELYPGWALEPIALVFFDSPQRIISIQDYEKEFLDRYPDSPKEWIHQMYELQPFTRFGFYPVKDLEKLE